jgi:hypothetical protein
VVLPVFILLLNANCPGVCFRGRARECAFQPIKNPKTVQFSGRHRENPFLDIVLADCANNHKISICSDPLHTFFYPDYTVGPGVSPDPAAWLLVGFTTDREL